jgi:hypothetical protein
MREQQQATQNPPTFGRYGEIPPEQFSPKQKEAYDYIVQDQNPVSLRYELGGSGKVVSTVSLAFWSKFSNPACPRCVPASCQSSQRGEAGPLCQASR